MKIFLKINNCKGFSLMEMIVVIFVTTMGLVGVMSLVVQNIQIERVNKNMLIASQLAQEGLELVRNKRDNNWFNKDDWELGGAAANTDIIGDGDYAINYDGEIIDIDDISDADAVLYLDVSGFYVHDTTPGGAISTEFSRMIIADTDTSNASTTFQCLIQWDERGSTYNYVAETVLYDWLSA